MRMSGKPKTTVSLEEIKNEREKKGSQREKNTENKQERKVSGRGVWYHDGRTARESRSNWGKLQHGTPSKVEPRIKRVRQTGKKEKGGGGTPVPRRGMKRQRGKKVCKFQDLVKAQRVPKTRPKKKGKDKARGGVSSGPFV